MSFIPRDPEVPFNPDPTGEKCFCRYSANVDIFVRGTGYPTPEGTTKCAEPFTWHLNVGEYASCSPTWLQMDTGWYATLWVPPWFAPCTFQFSMGIMKDGGNCGCGTKFKSNHFEKNGGPVTGSGLPKPFQDLADGKDADTIKSSLIEHLKSLGVCEPEKGNISNFCKNGFDNKPRCK